MAKNEKGRFFRKKNNFFIADVTPFRDTRLTFKAKGLMTYFIDKPDDWVFHINHMVDQSPEGEKSVRSGLNELKEYGYVVRVAFRKGGRVADYQFLFYEEPVKYPSKKDLHVDLDAWNQYVADQDQEIIDITVFHAEQKAKKQVSQKGKPDQTRANTQLDQVSGFQHPEKQHPEKQDAENAGLLNNKDTNHLSLSNTKDDDDKVPASAWEKDSAYNEYRNRIMDGNGEDIAVHSRHYPVFRQLVDKIGVSELFLMLDRYITAVTNGEYSHKTPQAVWFLKGGWKNYDHREQPKPKRKPNRHPSPSRSGSQKKDDLAGLPRAIREAEERKQRGEEWGKEEWEVNPEVEARLRAKLDRMRLKFKEGQKNGTIGVQNK